jgi:hypothetical protein
VLDYRARKPEKVDAMKNRPMTPLIASLKKWSAAK